MIQTVQKTIQSSFIDENCNFPYGRLKNVKKSSGSGTFMIMIGS